MSEREEASLIPTQCYAVAVVENYDTPIDDDAPCSTRIFAVKTFTNCPETAKFAKVFARERFPLYGIRSLSVHVRSCGIIKEYI